MSGFLQIAASDGHTIFFDIILLAITVVWGGALAGIIVHSKIKYGMFQKHLLIQANKMRK